MATLEQWENGELISIKDNIEYNTLKSKPQLYGVQYSNKYFKLELIDLVHGISDHDFQYLIFKSEEEINGKNIHIISVNDGIFNQILDYDKWLLDKIKNDFSNVNRVCVDYGHKGLEDFLETYNKLKDEYPERML